MFLPWSLISRGSKKKDSSRKVTTRPRSDSKPGSYVRRSKVNIEELEDRTLMATYIVDTSFTGVTSNGNVATPYKNIQDALKKAADISSPGADTVIVYGNNLADNSPTPHVYVWGRDTDINADGILDGNMQVGSSATETVKLIFRANERNIANIDGSGGPVANLIVKMRDNIVDVLNGSTLRLEGNNTGSKVTFTSLLDDVGGDTNQDGTTNFPDRANWGGIRYRAGAVDQDASGPGANGSLINWADIRYTGQTIFDTVLGAPTEFGSVRMEADATNKDNVFAAQVRIWNTIFRHGGRAIDININAIGRGFNSSNDPTNLLTGPDLGAANTQPLTFEDNSINGAFIFLPFEPSTGNILQQYVSATLDDVGVPYAATNRWVIANSLTTPGLSSPAGGVTLSINKGMVMKFQNTALDASDKADLRDRTWGTVSVNGTVDQPVIFTSLTDDIGDLLAKYPTLNGYYDNGSADTNNDGNATLPSAGDWGGLRVGQGNIDHSIFRYGGGLVNIAGIFSNYSPIEIFCRDLTPFGFGIQNLRVANNEVTNTFTGVIFGSFYDSPAINLISRDWGDSRFAPPAILQRGGDVAVIDNHVHDNLGKAIESHPLYFDTNPNTVGGYGAHFRRNILEANFNNSLFIHFELDQARGIDRNLPRGGGYFDDTDIVHNYEGQALIVHTDQTFQMQSRRGIVPAGGYYDRFSTEATFMASLVMSLPGINPIPLQRGPFSVNAGLVDHGLFYFNTDFSFDARQNGINPTVANPVPVRGEEWRDWGVNFQTANGGSDPLRPVQVFKDAATNLNYISTSDPNGNGTFDVVFPNAVSAVGFQLLGNPVTSGNKRIEFYTFNPTSQKDELIESFQMPATGATGLYLGRVSKSPIHIVRFIDESGDGSNVGISKLTWVDASESLVLKANTEQSRITAGGVENGYANSVQSATPSGGSIITDGFSAAGVTPRFATVASFNANLAVNTIKANSQPSVFTLNVPSDVLISDVTARIRLNIGSSVGALDITLTGPDGRAVKLLTPNTTTGTSMNTTFDDRAPNYIGNTAGVALTTSSDFNNTLPTTSTPFGLGSSKGTNARGTWTLTIVNSSGSTGVLQNFTLNVRQIQSHQGGTLRILGQGGTPVVFTSIADDTIGAGPVLFVQKDNGSDGPTAAIPGAWEGIQIMQGASTNASQRQVQAANGSILQRYNDFNPYTIGDEQLIYPGVTVPTTGALSALDQMDLMGLGSVSSSNPFNATNIATLQDGTLIERAEIRFARAGIVSKANPEGKLSIDGLDIEGNEAAPNGIFPGVQLDGTPSNEILMPLPRLISRDTDGRTVFATDTGSYRFEGRLGGTSQSTVTSDVDWFELPEPTANFVDYRVHIDTGSRAFGFDEKNGTARQRIGVAVFNSQRRLQFLSSGNPTFDAFFQPAFPSVAWSGNDLVFETVAGDHDFTSGNPDAIDGLYLAIFPAGRIPRSFISTMAVPPGLLANATTFPDVNADATSFVTGGGQPYQTLSNGVVIGWWIDRMAGSNVDSPTQDDFWDPNNLRGAVVGGYEMEITVIGTSNPGEATPIDSSFLQWRNEAPKRDDAQILIQNNLITNFQTVGIDLGTYRRTMGNTNLGETVPGQVARFDITTRATNFDGSVLANREVNPNNPQFNAQADFLPGVIVRNNIINRGQGDGIVMTDDLNSNVGVSPTNRPNPTVFHQITNNTIDGNAGTGVIERSRGGATIQNNIISNNGQGFLNTDYGDFSALTPPLRTVFSYNIVYNNGTNTAGNLFNGSNNIIGNTSAADPQYVDAASLDYRLKLTSPGVDSAVSDITDRLRLVRFPQEPTRAPLDDYRGRRRVDNLTRPNVGGGAQPFYDRGALETNEFSLRVISSNVVTPSAMVTRPVTRLVITFAGRVDLSTLINSGTQSIFLRIGGVTGTIIPLDFVAADSTYDSVTDQHTFIIPLANGNQLNDGNYTLILNGTAHTGQGIVKDVAGQNLDGEFPSPFIFPSGDNAPGGDFIYGFQVKTSTLKGLVWDNANGNSTKEASEAGIPNAQIDLTYAGFDRLFGTSDDETFGPYFTDATGNYTAPFLPAGIFRVTVSGVPANYVLNTPPMPRVLELPIGGTVSNVNFGYWRDLGNAVVNGSIYNDVNGNGIKDAGETNTGLGQPEVTLISAGADFMLGTADDVTTQLIVDSAGNYSFNALFGNYYSVNIDTTNVPPTFQRTSPSTLPFLISPLLPGTTRTVNFGFQEKQSFINGSIFRDLNGNGVNDGGGETGIGSVTVTLTGAGIDGNFGTADDVVFTSQITDANGNYSFGPTTQGNYRVGIDYLNSPILNTFFLTTANVPQTVVLPDGHSTVNASPIGFRPDPFGGNISGIVFLDSINIGTFDVGETGVDGVNIQLVWAGRDDNINTASDNQTFNFTTSGGGLFAATGLPIGTFYIQPTTVPPSLNGFGLTTGAVPFIRTVTFANQAVTGVNFGYQPRNSSIAGIIFNDLNGDGNRQAGENSGLQGVRVYIDRNNDGVWNSGTEEASISTAGGAYSFANLAPANNLKLRVDESTLSNPLIPPGFVRTTDLGTFNLAANTNLTGKDMGAQQRNSTATAFVFDDLNGDGQFNTGDSPRVNFQVTLTYNGTLPVNFTSPIIGFTAGDGRVVFNSLPVGNYTMSIVAPAGVTVIGGATRNFNLTGVSGGSSQSFGLQPNNGSQFQSGIFYMSFAGTTNTLTNSDGSTITVSNSDIVRLRVRAAGDYDYALFFKGADVSLTPGGNEAIDAFTIDRQGRLIISTRGGFSVLGPNSTTLTGLGEDLLLFTPTGNSVNGGPTSGDWSLFFKGSKVGLSGAAENVDAVSLIYASSAANAAISRILLSTSGNATVAGATATPQDILSFAPTAYGVNTAGTFTRYFTGTTYGLNTSSTENIDALFFLPTANSNQPRLFMSTSGSFAVPGQTGNNGDILQFNVTTSPPSVAGRGSFVGVPVRGANFGYAGNNLTGYYQGSITTDPDPFGNPPANFAGFRAPAGLSMSRDVANALINGNGTDDNKVDDLFSTSSRSRRTAALLLAKSLVR